MAISLAASGMHDPSPVHQRIDLVMREVPDGKLPGCQWVAGFKALERGSLCPVGEGRPFESSRKPPLPQVWSVMHSGFRVHGLGGAQTTREVLFLAHINGYFRSDR